MSKKKPTKPWPTKDAMQQVYTEHLWGGDEFDFYSGEGSHSPELIEPYVNSVQAFLSSFEEPLTVCDLGCGDFNVGMKLVEHTKKYVALDIVPKLFDRNKKLFKAGNLEFRCLDIAKDALPVADCAIVKQVLQHLSNQEVQQVVEKLQNYKYVLLTEHVPEGEFEANLDIISGQGTRLKKNSGLILTVPPFNFSIKEEQLLCSVPLEAGKGIIETKLYTI
ncbi:MAG: methyltransferase domain-containing protein [Balneola sp.]